MTDYQNFKSDRIYDLYKTMWQKVADENSGGNVDAAMKRFDIRRGYADDWDSITESDYSYDWSSDGDQITAGAAFLMDPVQKFECVGVYGWNNGNVSTTVNHLEVWLNNEKVREYFGYEVTSQPDGIYIFDDPIYGSKSQVLKVIPNTTSASSTSRAFPLFFVIKTK